MSHHGPSPLSLLVCPGARPAVSAISCKGPGLSRGTKAARAPGSSPAGSNLTGGFKSPQGAARAAASGATSSRDTGSKGTAAAAAGRGLGGLGTAMGRGSQATGMFGGAAYRVAGLRRPAKK